MKKILCLSGSLRAASSSRAVLEAACRWLEEGRASVARFDIGSLPHYNVDLGQPEVVQAFKAAIEQADGLIIVTPEYNYSVPGVLKNAIDWASRPAYASVFAGKPVFVASTSGGVLGGVRAQAHLKYILNGMLAQVFTWREIVVTHANDKVKDGLLDDEATRTFLLQGVEAFVRSLEDR